VVAWKSVRTFQGKGRLRAWLLGIVHHTVMKSLRHHFQPITAEVEGKMVSGSASPEEQAEKDEQADQLRPGLRAPSPEQRAVVELIFYHGFSLREAAEVCRLHLGTIKSRLSYARRSLRGGGIKQG
jgi:RNA polymerase sigma-70 factor (ECF subfamily)